MKTLILSDETYELMRVALNDTHQGRSVLRRLDTDIPLPSDRELIALAESGGEAPEAVKHAVAARDAGTQAAIDTREELERLLFHLRDGGIRPSVLRRWFGYGESRMFQLLAAEKERRERATV